MAGTTIYNALKIGELEVVEGTDRPVEPPHIVRVDVVWNPFEDIVPRNLRPRAEEVIVGGVGEEEARGKKRKNLALLSFGDEAEAEEEELQAAPKPRVKSIHDAVEDDARLVKAGTAAEEEVRAKLDAEWERERAARAVRSKLAGTREQAGEQAEQQPAGGDEDQDFEGRMRQKILDKRRELGAAAPSARPDTAAAEAGKGGETAAEKEARRAARRREKEEAEAAKRAAEAEKLRRLGLTKLAAEDAALYTAGEVKRREIKHKRAHTADRENETLAKLAKFQQSLASTAPGAVPAAPAPEREGAAGLTRFVAEGLYYAASDPEDDDPTAWRRHALRFDAANAAKDGKAFAPSADDYVVVDPLLEKGKEAFFKSKAGKRQTEWAGRSRT